MVKTYTFETIPSSIKPDQFYYFCKRTGNVGLGTVLGSSAVSLRTILSINGCTTSTYYKFDDTYRYTSIDIRGERFKCYRSYQNFAEDYTKYIEARRSKERAKRQPAKYIVDKNSFFCRRSFCSKIPSEFKVFETKDEAMEYSKKGIESLKRFTERYIPLVEDLSARIHNKEKELIRKLGEKYLDPRLADLQVKFQDLKVDDILLKVEGCTIGDLIRFDRIKPEFSIRVSGFIDSTTVKFSDGTVLMRMENPYNIFNCRSRFEVEKVLCARNIKNLVSRIDYDVRTMCR